MDGAKGLSGSDFQERDIVGHFGTFAAFERVGFRPDRYASIRLSKNKMRPSIYTWRAARLCA